MARDGTIKINTELDSSKAQSAMEKFASFSMRALKGIAVAAGTTAAAMTGYAIKVGSDFEAGMSKVSAISGATAEELKKLEEQAISLGASTAYSASEAAQGMENLASAGFAVNEITEAMPGMLNLAASSGENLAVAADIAASTLRGFGLEANQAAHVADVLAKNAADTNAAVYDTGGAMKYVAPVASAMGLSLEETTASIGIMANAGIQGSQAGTTLRAALSRLVKPTETMRDTMKDLGLSFFDSKGKMLSLTDMMAMLEEKTAGLTDEQKNAAMATLFGQEALSGMLALIDAGPEQLAALTKGLENCDGAAEEMAETMLDNLKGSMEGFLGATETFGIKVYEQIQEPLKEAVDTGTECINRLSSAFEADGLNGTVEEAAEIFGELVEKVEDTSDVAKEIITPFKNIINTGKTTGKTVIPTAVKGFEILAENIDMAATVTVTACTAFITYNALTKTTSAVLGLAAKAQAAMNAVMSMNPAWLVLSAVTALTAGLIAYNLTLDESEKSMSKFTEEQEQSIETLNETTEALRDARTAREENVQAIDLEYDGYEKLLDELRSITDENGNVSEGYEERARIIAEQLNQELGTEIAVADGKIEKYQEVAAAIEEVIQKKKAEALLTSLQEDMNNAYKDFSEVSKDYQNALAAQKEKKEELEIVTQDYLEAEKKMQEAMGTMNESMALAEFKEMEFLLNDTKDAYETAASAAYGYEQELNSLANEVNNYRELQAAVAEGDAQKISAAMDELLLGYTAYSEEMLAESESIRKEMYDKASAAVETLKMIQEQGGEIYAAFGKESSNAVAEIIDNFNQLPGGIAQGIEDIGPEASSAMIAALIQADLDGKLSEEGQSSLRSLLQAYSTLPEDLKNQIMMGVDGALGGFDDGIPRINAKGEEMCSSLLETMKNYGIEDETYRLGSESIDEFNDGMLSQEDNTEAAGIAIAEAAEDGAATADGYTPGSDFGEGFAGGIGSWVSKATNKAVEMASAVANAVKRRLDEHSPSRLSRKFGRWFSQGLGLGVSDEEDYAVSKAEKLSEKTLDALDTDALSEKIKGIDAPGVMARINMAAEDKHSRISDTVVAGVSAKENYLLNSAPESKLEIDYKKLGKEFGETVLDGMSQMKFQIGQREFERLVRRCRE